MSGTEPWSKSDDPNQPRSESIDPTTATLFCQAGEWFARPDAEPRNQYSLTHWISGLDTKKEYRAEGRIVEGDDADIPQFYVEAVSTRVGR